MAADLFTEEEMEIDEGVGYPKAYAKLCRDRSFGPYSHGPPFTFTPYALQQNEALRARDLDEMFPIIDPKAKPTTKPKIFVSLLWKQLNHLGNAGFDPATFRVDTYGNVLYYRADSASPLAWDIDHWFPCSRGGLTVPSNLRILQRQVCKKKHNKLELLIPWWDLQVGISINQFLSIFASSNSDFRHRAFSLLFSEGESEELNVSQTVDSHTFPHHFVESKEQLGLAPAAVVLSRRESFDASTALKSLDINRRPRSNTPVIASRKSKPSMSKENENPDIVSNPYQAIVTARDSLRQREENSKIQAEIQKLDNEMDEFQQKADDEKAAIQDLELVLIKRRRRAEKSRRLAEAQSSYRVMLEKMIRDAMHQSVIYKEQLRLNQAAANALMARLEAQKAMCDSSEKELHRRFRERDELENRIRPAWEQARKRSRMNDALVEERDDKNILYLQGNKLGTCSKNDALVEERDDKNILYLQGNKLETCSKRAIGETLLKEKETKNVLFLPGNKEGEPLHKELRVFLEEEHKASEAGISPNEERMREEIEGREKRSVEECNTEIVAVEDEYSIEDKLQTLNIEECGKICNLQFPVIREAEREEDEESRKLRGKGNVEKWLQMLLENNEEDHNLNPQNSNDKKTSRTDEIIRKMDLKYPQKEIKTTRFQESQETEGVKEEEEIVEKEATEDLRLETQNTEGVKEEEEIVEKEATEDLRLEIQNTDCVKEVHKEINHQTVQKKDGGKREEGIVEEKATATLLLKNPPYKLQKITSYANEVGNRNSCEGKEERREKNGKERGLVRSESARMFRRIPSSPSMILGMRKGVDCIGKKPLVIGDDDDGDDDGARVNGFIKSSIKTIKKAVKM